VNWRNRQSLRRGWWGASDRHRAGTERAQGTTGSRSVHRNTAVEGTPSSRVECPDEFTWVPALRASRAVRDEAPPRNEARALPREPPRALPQGPPRRGHGGARGADPGGRRADVRDRRQGARAVADRGGSHADRPPLAGLLQARLLPGWPYPDQR